MCLLALLPLWQVARPKKRKDHLAHGLRGFSPLCVGVGGWSSAHPARQEAERRAWGTGLTLKNSVPASRQPSPKS